MGGVGGSGRRAKGWEEEESRTALTSILSPCSKQSHTSSPHSPAAGRPPWNRAAQTAGTPRPAPAASPAGRGGKGAGGKRGQWAGTQQNGPFPELLTTQSRHGCHWHAGGSSTILASQRPACLQALAQLTSYISLAAKAWSHDRAGKLRSVSTRLPEAREQHSNSGTGAVIGEAVES